jgi:recombination protein RecT
MTIKQIENHEKKNRKGEYQGKGWRDDWDAMARKTVYRRLIGKWGVMSITYQNAAEGAALAQQMRDEGYTDDPAPTFPDIIEGEAIDIDPESGEVIE